MKHNNISVIIGLLGWIGGWMLAINGMWKWSALGFNIGCIGFYVAYLCMCEYPKGDKNGLG